MTSTTETIKPVLFDELADCLTELGGDGHPSEIHGYLSGLFSSGSEPSEKKWLAQVAEQLGDKTLNAHSEEVLVRVYAGTQQQLESSEFSIQMLLPDDEESLAARTESLGIWCQSFISGFGQGLGKQDVSEVIEEILRDFAEISMIEPSEDSEESEKLYMEVSEFVRMAWLTVYTEVAGKPSPKQGSVLASGGTLH